MREIGDGVPAKSTPVPHPGRKVRIACRVGAKGNPYSVGEDCLQHFSETTKYTFTRLTGADALARLDPSAFDLLYDGLPEAVYSAAECKTVFALLARGARIFLSGENQGFAAEENKRVTQIINTLGGAMVVLPESIMTVVDKFHGTHPLCAGVSEMSFNNWAPLAIEPTPGVEVVMGNKDGRIAMVDLPMSRGALTVVADINVFGQGNATFWQNLAHIAAASVDKASPPPPSAAAQVAENKAATLS